MVWVKMTTPLTLGEHHSYDYNNNHMQVRGHLWSWFFKNVDSLQRLEMGNQQQSPGLKSDVDPLIHPDLVPICTLSLYNKIT